MILNIISEARDKLITTIECAIEKVDEKVGSHLMETHAEVSDDFIATCLVWLPVKSASHLRLAAE
jgi:hypothetical protein